MTARREALSSALLTDILGPVLEVLPDLGHELACVRAVDDAVIEAQGQVEEVADRDGVRPVCAGDDGRFLQQRSPTENRALRLIDDGRAELLAKDAGIRDGEGAGADLVGLEALAAGALRQIGNGTGDAEEVLLL